MKEDENLLSARLARLRRPSSTVTGGDGRSEGSHELKGMQHRFAALSGGNDAHAGSEQSFNCRLAALSGGPTEVPSAEDLTARLESLSHAPAASEMRTAAPQRGQEKKGDYHVPDDFTDEWQDLDDLLEDALQGKRDGLGSFRKDSSFSPPAATAVQIESGSPRHADHTPPSARQIDASLNEIDALLRKEVESMGVDRRRPCGAAAAAGFERAGGEAEKLMEAFLSDGRAADENGGKRLVDDGLDGEEQRLVQMLTDQVRLEGHGLISQPPGSSVENSDKLWLPIAPTAKPVARPYGGTSRHSNPANSNVNSDTGLDARLVAQQAMDEARLNLSDNTLPPPRVREVGANGINTSNAGKRKEDREGGVDVWCSICSEDAAVRCTTCEEENGGGEDDDNEDGQQELYCLRCFREIHRDDPEMRSHQPQALPRGKGGTDEIASGSKKTSRFRTWKR